jgi:hypothetical protein
MDFLPEEIEMKIWRMVHEMGYYVSMKEILNRFFTPDGYLYHYIHHEALGADKVFMEYKNTCCCECHGPYWECIEWEKIYFVKVKETCRFEKAYNEEYYKYKCDDNEEYYCTNRILDDIREFPKFYKEEPINYLKQNGIRHNKKITRAQLIKLCLSF